MNDETMETMEKPTSIDENADQATLYRYLSLEHSGAEAAARKR